MAREKTISMEDHITITRGELNDLRVKWMRSGVKQGKKEMLGEVIKKVESSSDLEFIDWLGKTNKEIHK